MKANVRVLVALRMVEMSMVEGADAPACRCTSGISVDARILGASIDLNHAAIALEIYDPGRPVAMDVIPDLVLTYEVARVREVSDALGALDDLEWAAGRSARSLKDAPATAERVRRLLLELKR